MISKAVFIWFKTNAAKYSEILLQFTINILIYLILIYSCEGNTEFSAVLLQSSVSHDPSEIIY